MNSSKGFANFISLLLLVILLLGGAYLVYDKQENAKVTPTTNTLTDASVGSNSSTSLRKIDTADWQTYNNTEYKFELKHPANSVIESRPQSKYNDEYIRIQNYQSNEDMFVLKSGEYYLEMSISNIERSCEEELEQALQVSVGGNVAYRGLGLPGGDAGGQRYALCINKGGNHFYIQATENSSTGDLANAILDSFIFTE